jgi:hypothetical protein
MWHLRVTGITSTLVLWKARVTQLGDFELKVRSSTGVTHVKNISVQAGR